MKKINLLFVGALSLTLCTSIDAMQYYLVSQSPRIDRNQFKLALAYVLNNYNPGPWATPITLETNFGGYKETREWHDGTPHTATHQALNGLLKEYENSGRHSSYLETIGRVLTIAHQHNERVRNNPSLAKELAEKNKFYELFATIRWDETLVRRLEDTYQPHR
ncbi:MAG: hypothetical protein Q8Q25_02280 [bacterium]|nr:hypothetical protein [bacterium]